MAYQASLVRKPLATIITPDPFFLPRLSLHGLLIGDTIPLDFSYLRVHESAIIGYIFH